MDVENAPLLWCINTPLPLTNEDYCAHSVLLLLMKHSVCMLYVM